MSGLRKRRATMRNGRWLVAVASMLCACGSDENGRVTSKEPVCVPNRKVTLLEVAPERGPIDLADNRTNGNGKWVFSSELQGATIIQAKVAQSKASGVICRSARSGAKRL